MAKSKTVNRKQTTKKSIIKELSPTQLKWNCPKSFFKFKSTQNIEPLDKIVGQPRAIDSIKLGAELQSKGYNIFVTGLSGTGRLTTVKNVLEDVTSIKPKTYDYCYVYNFGSPDEPMLIKLGKGRGKEFADTIKDSISYLRKHLPKLFDEANFQKGRRKVIEKFQNFEKEILDKFDAKIRPKGFVRGHLETEQGVNVPEVFPVVEGNAVHIDTLAEYIQQGKLTVKQSENLQNLYHKFKTELLELNRIGVKNLQKFKKALYEYDKSAISVLLDSIFDQLHNVYSNEKVIQYVDGIKSYILDHLNKFVANQNPLELAQNGEQGETEDIWQLFDVNVILDNSKTDSVPVIVETAPTYTNLFGTIERSFDSRGYWQTDFTKIKAGSILRADQGYLIVNALDLFQEQGVWTALKRVLLYDKLEIQPYEAIFQLSQLHLKPEAIDVKVKVIIIGGQTLFYWLWANEKGFKKMFKVNAQFDYETERTDEMMNYYAQFAAKICKEDNLPPCSPDGIAAVVEWAVDHAGSQSRITLKFSDVADVIREAAFVNGTKSKRKRAIKRTDVTKALAARRHRNNLLDEKLKDSILEGSILIDTEGERIGQINGLTVLDTALLMFGKPARITAAVSAGDSGIINIEREVDMSGSIHSKGVLILTGFLREMFGKKKALSLTASIAFEQNYGGIDGDSATAAEIYCLLSAITEIPIKQSFAITGSANQKGDIQPIGGVNEKIRGFFEVCKERGLDGTHSVIIPQQNVKDLMLCDEIIDSVKKKQFHIYPISKIEDGVELLMGMKPGKLEKNGEYTKDSLFALVMEKLEELRDDKKKKKKSSAKSKAETTTKAGAMTLEQVLEIEQDN